MSGPSATAKPMSAKISTHLVEHLADRVDAPVRSGPARTGSVTSAARWPGGLRARSRSRSALRAFQRLADARLEAVDRLAEGLALLRRQGAQRRHQLGDAALLAERGDAHLLDRGQIGGGGDRGEEPLSRAVEIESVCVMPLSSRPQRASSIGALEPGPRLYASRGALRRLGPGSFGIAPRCRDDSVQRRLLRPRRRPGRRAP